MPNSVVALVVAAEERDLHGEVAAGLGPPPSNQIGYNDNQD